MCVIGVLMPYINPLFPKGANLDQLVLLLRTKRNPNTLLRYKQADPPGGSALAGGRTDGEQTPGVRLDLYFPSEDESTAGRLRALRLSKPCCRSATWSRSAPRPEGDRRGAPGVAAPRRQEQPGGARSGGCLPEGCRQRRGQPGYRRWQMSPQPGVSRGGAIPPLAPAARSPASDGAQAPTGEA